MEDADDDDELAEEAAEEPDARLAASLERLSSAASSFAVAMAASKSASSFSASSSEASVSPSSAATSLEFEAANGGKRASSSFSDCKRKRRCATTRRDELSAGTRGAASTSCLLVALVEVGEEPRRKGVFGQELVPFHVELETLERVSIKSNENDEARAEKPLIIVFRLERSAWRGAPPLKHQVNHHSDLYEQPRIMINSERANGPISSRPSWPSEFSHAR